MPPRHPPPIFPLTICISALSAAPSWSTKAAVSFAEAAASPSAAKRNQSKIPIESSDGDFVMCFPEGGQPSAHRKPRKAEGRLPYEKRSLLFSLCQQHQNLDGISCRALSDLIAAAIPPKTCGFPGTPMQLDFVRINRPKSYAGLPARWCSGVVILPLPEASKSGRRWLPRPYAPGRRSTKGSDQCRKSDPPGHGQPTPDPDQRYPGGWDNPGPQNR